MKLDLRKISSTDTGKYAKSDPCWMNLEFPKYKAKVNLTHLTINNNVDLFLEDSRFFAFSKHQTKATGIDEMVVLRDSAKVYGLVYDIAGNTASSVQFYLTDSTRHFFRGALYFEAVPNIDSLKIVIDFLKKDILHLIQTTKWKDRDQKTALK
jgi:gliding motility-associated lipoprotein GldD